MLGIGSLTSQHAWPSMSGNNQRLELLVCRAGNVDRIVIQRSQRHRPSRKCKATEFLLGRLMVRVIFCLLQPLAVVGSIWKVLGIRLITIHACRAVIWRYHGTSCCASRHGTMSFNLDAIHQPLDSYTAPHTRKSPSFSIQGKQM